MEKTKKGIHIYGKSNKLITPNGYIVGKPVKFGLKDQFQVTDTSVLSTDLLYIKKCYKRFWFKFFSNGKVIHGFDSNIPINETDQFFGWGGYYKIDGATITVELSYTQRSDQRSKLFIKGKIVGDTLKFYEDRFGKRAHNLHHFTIPPRQSDTGCHYYIMAKDPFKLKDPDW